MFSSLDRVDMAVEDDGTVTYVQTDHRTPQEMDETPEVSVLFALVRTLVPRRLADTKRPPSRIKYASLDGASAAVAEAVASTGAIVESGMLGTPMLVPYEGTPRSAAEIADDAFASLAHRVALREGLPLSAEGLATFEDRLRERGLSPDDPDVEIESWTGIIELAAFAGECLRLRDGSGRWAITDELFLEESDINPPDLGLLPFLFSAGGGFMHNAANKAIRALREPGQSTVHLLASGKPAAERGTTMAVLKPPSWGMDGIHARPLIEKLPDGPLVVIAEDHPNNVAYPTRDEGSDPDALFAEAIRNLSDVDVDVEKLDIDVEMDLYVVHGHFYAAEKILDEAFMHRMHALLRHELLAVAIPVKSRMFVTRGIQAPENLARLMALAQSVHDNEAHPISPQVFGVMGGRVSAMIQPSGAPRPRPTPEPEPKQGFWSRLFN